LHIPLIFGYDVIHGFRTIYPVPIALAASWDPAQVEKVQSMAAREASSVGVNWTLRQWWTLRAIRAGAALWRARERILIWAPVWPKRRCGGFQGDAIGAPNHILACVKHFAGYGAAEGGRDYDSSNISDEQLWNVYLPPFEAAVRAGAGSLMSAYMDLNGVPATGNRWLLHHVLREKWGFQGFVVSDWGSISSLTTHGFASGPEDAAVRAVNAGVDMEMTTGVYRNNLPAAVKKGLVKQVDDRCCGAADSGCRSTSWGLFKDPYVAPERCERELVSTTQREAARTAADRTAVLFA